MPLSEHEQRQLEQIEQGLYREDRRLARLVRSSDPRVHYRRRVAQALVGLVLGAAMIAVGIVFVVIGLAVGGFVVVLLCGIGFTMSLFIGSLAFRNGPMIVETKLGVLAGSIASALCGYLVMRGAAPARRPRISSAARPNCRRRSPGRGLPV